MEWAPYKLPGGYRRWGARPLKPGEVLPPSVYDCVYCRGEGKALLHNRIFTCRVCKGTGTIYMEQPAVQCTYCRGTGKQERGRDLPCRVCKGRGIVPVVEPVEVCPDCKGRGRELKGKLPCQMCKGSGVVSKEQAEKVLQSQRRGDGGEGSQGFCSVTGVGSAPTGTEVEALGKIAEFEEGRTHFQQIARRLGRNSSYARVLCRSLGKGDYIDFNNSGIAQITPKGVEELRRRGLLKKEIELPGDPLVKEPQPHKGPVFKWGE